MLKNKIATITIHIYCFCSYSIYYTLFGLPLYRCGDNIGFSYMYGILPFFAFPDRIPKDAKYIYVLSDHPSR